VQALALTVLHTPPRHHTAATNIKRAAVCDLRSSRAEVLSLSLSHHYCRNSAMAAICWE